MNNGIWHKYWMNIGIYHLCIEKTIAMSKLSRKSRRTTFSTCLLICFSVSSFSQIKGIPDGKYLFFLKMGMGYNDIYWVSANLIEKLRPGSKK
jgi:hypothetical protein